MQTFPQEVSGVYHPFIDHMYIKETSGKNHKSSRTLIIEALQSDEDDNHMLDILIDLDDLRKQIQANVSRFDDVEIRTR